MQENEVNVTDDKMTDFEKMVKISNHVMRPKRFKEIRNILRSLLSDKVPYSKENMMKYGITLDEILYLEFKGVIALRENGTYWIYWHENEYKPSRTLDKMERDLDYYTPETFKHRLNGVCKEWYGHIRGYKDEYLEIIEEFAKDMKEEINFLTKENFSVEDLF